VLPVEFGHNLIKFCGYLEAFHWCF